MPGDYQLIVSEMIRCLNLGGSLLITFLNSNFPPFDLHDFKAWLNRKRNRPPRFSWQAYDYEPNLFDRERILKLLQEEKDEIALVKSYFFGVLFAFAANYFCYLVHSLFKISDDRLLPIAKAGIALDMKVGNWLNAFHILLQIKKMKRLSLAHEHEQYGDSYRGNQHDGIPLSNVPLLRETLYNVVLLMEKEGI